MNSKKIFLDYDPQYQGIVKFSAYLWFVCFAIFMLRFTPKHAGPAQVS